MTVLLKDALKPNLVQTLEGQPVMMHCGPFANIAHGNNSLVADRVAMKLGDYICTESGFGADMGMEKFFDIVCRFGNLKPSRGRAGDDRARDQAPRRRRGRRTVGSSQPPRDRDGDGERPPAPEDDRRHSACRPSWRSTAAPATPTRRSSWSSGSRSKRARSAPRSTMASRTAAKGVTELAQAVVDACEQPNSFHFMYEDDAPIKDKIEAVAKNVYGASDVYLYPEAEDKIHQFTKQGLGHFPVCMAKTHLSLSSDPTLLNVPENFTPPGSRHPRLHRCRLAGAAVRRHPADARPRQDARRAQHRHRRERAHGRPVLGGRVGLKTRSIAYVGADRRHSQHR